VIPETGEPMELVLWDEEGGKAIGIYSMTGAARPISSTSAARLIFTGSSRSG
jgi:hypothetical protein